MEKQDAHDPRSPKSFLDQWVHRRLTDGPYKDVSSQVQPHQVRTEEVEESIPTEEQCLIECSISPDRQIKDIEDSAIQDFMRKNHQDIEE
ncbi:hypothetical protein TIFTF001_015371 [Ficus carica]|uniref:Uncharacterized protein n=1 Tax=Ficus carica TaxID=3494 RepID=A0AA88A4D1_FICCA|nr:hypothetical protein TIFTF001_015371 [Ficus carica]